MARHKKTKRHGKSGPQGKSGPLPPRARSKQSIELCREAGRLIEAGDFDAAEAMLDEFDPMKRRDADALHLLGLAKVRKGRFQEGMSMIDRSILASPDAAWMRINRAAVRQGKAEHESAVADLEKAVELAPKTSEAWSNLAASRSVLGDYPGAADAAKRAADLNPKSHVALTTYGATLNRAGKCEAAVEVYRRALAIKPDHLNARVSLLLALHKLGRSAEARAETDLIAKRLGARVADGETGGPRDAHIDSAMAAAIGKSIPEDAVVAMALDGIGLFDQALEYAEAACAKHPDDPNGWAIKGVLHYRKDDPDAAVAPLRRAVELRPNWAEIVGALGNVLWLSEHTDEAVAMTERAVELAPQMGSLWATLGAARRDARDLPGAEAAYAEALRLEPHAGGHALSLALIQIRQKKFAEGYRNYERRWDTANFADQVRPHAHPIWDGGSLTAKKILVYAEQGVGDEVMYASALQALVDQGAAVYLEASARLVNLFQRSMPGVIVGQAQNPVLPAFTGDDFDCMIPGGALMGRLAPTYADLRPQGAYLKADPDQTRELAERYRAPMADGAPPKLVIGLAWLSGNPNTGRRRSAALDLWGPILETPGVRFVNLQYGDCSEDLTKARDATGADILHDDKIDNYGELDSFASQVAAMDLVVSIDNSTVHFAGALGVPTLMLLNHEPDWRWFGAEEGNPWYEAVAHLRQETPGDWPPVMAAAAEVVARMAADGTPPAVADPLRPAMVNRGARPKALLLNDTTVWYHWGCTATSLGIRREIAAKGYDIQATHIRAVYDARPAPARMADFDDDAFFDRFVAENALLMRQATEADRIVVNGEGTLHGLSDNVRGLLYLIHAAATRLGKPVQVINHSCYPEDAPKVTDPVANGLYRKVYAGLEYAAFREHVSRGLMSKIGVEGALSFDSLPLTAKRMRADLPSKRERRLVIAGSASADDRTAANFAEYARWAGGQGWTIVLLNGARAFPPADETTFIQALARHGLPTGTELVVARSLERWMSEFARAGLVATGRFHHSIAAFSLGAPFVAAGSNTAKTHAISELLERPRPLPVRDPNLAQMLIQAHGAALDMVEDPATHAARLEAVEMLAMENYARL